MCTAPPCGEPGLQTPPRRAFDAYALGLALFVLAFGALEQMGMPRRAIGISFPLASVAVYACIGMAGAALSIAAATFSNEIPGSRRR